MAKEKIDPRFAIQRIDKAPSGNLKDGANGVQHTTWYKEERPGRLFIGDGKGGVNKSTKMEFWPIEVSWGYGSKGQDAQSKLFSGYYHKANNQTPISIKARVPDEKYKDKFMSWVRHSQAYGAKGYIARARLEIPAASIAVWGFIPSVKAGHDAGYAPAPEIEFEFIITRDNLGSNKSVVSQYIIPYFLDPKDKYWTRQSRVYLESTLDPDENSELSIEERKAAAQAARFQKTLGSVKDWFGW